MSKKIVRPEVKVSMLVNGQSLCYEVDEETGEWVEPLVINLVTGQKGGVELFLLPFQTFSTENRIPPLKDIHVVHTYKAEDKLVEARAHQIPQIIQKRAAKAGIKIASANEVGRFGKN